MNNITPRDKIIEGYQLLERIGAGGYGEVWRAKAPGEIVKAVKIIYGQFDESRAGGELQALNRIKAVRHPFLLSLERIEVVDGRLMIVTELAECSLKDRLKECLDSKLPGIPRDELIGYLRDAADALDYLAEKHDLQHLDVKPENLMLLGGHVKVGDFGLVRDIRAATASLLHAMTPVYAAPELFDSKPSRFSDQYGLAITYQELLTNTVPFDGTTVAQLATQHLRSAPNLNSLSGPERLVIARALAKTPQQRFPNCRALVEALIQAGRPGQSARSATRPDGTAPGALSSPQIGPGGHRPTGRLSVALQRNGVGQAPGAMREEVAESPPAPDDGRTCRLSVYSANLVQTLPPLDVATAPLGFRPAVVVGIGGAAAQVLVRIRQGLRRQFGDATELPAIRYLLLDTDTKSLLDATGDAGLDRRSALHLPLRPTHEYRKKSDQFLRWISRRWIYNIPRSLRTDGLRPLGRLAYVDQAGAVATALRAAIAAAADPIALRETSERVGQPARTTVPRVFLIAALGGGTGSGTVLDVAQSVRFVLDQMDLPADALCALLPHFVDRDNGTAEQSRVNAYATLSELQQFNTIGSPGDADLPPIPAPLLPSAYVLNGDDPKHGDQYDSLLNEVATYVQCDVTSSLGGLFDACRQATPVDTSNVQVRSFLLQCSHVAGHSAPNVFDVCRRFAAEWQDALAPRDVDDVRRRLPSARVRLPGGARRAIALVPSEAWRKPLGEAVGAEPMLQAGSHEEVYLWHETERLSLAAIAGQIVATHPEYVQAASRLHTRIDVDWSHSLDLRV